MHTYGNRFPCSWSYINTTQKGVWVSGCKTSWHPAGSRESGGGSSWILPELSRAKGRSWSCARGWRAALRTRTWSCRALAPLMGAPPAELPQLRPLQDQQDSKSGRICRIGRIGRSGAAAASPEQAPELPRAGAALPWGRAGSAGGRPWHSRPGGAGAAPPLALPKVGLDRAEHPDPGAGVALDGQEGPSQPQPSCDNGSTWILNHICALYHVCTC